MTCLIILFVNATTCCCSTSPICISLSNLSNYFCNITHRSYFNSLFVFNPLAGILIDWLIGSDFFLWPGGLLLKTNGAKIISQKPFFYCVFLLLVFPFNDLIIPAIFNLIIPAIFISILGITVGNVNLPCFWEQI